jgi:protein phosphatase
MSVTDALEMVARTDVGRLRSHNEDAVFVNPAQGFALLADGMGGYNAGEVAAGMSVALLAAALARQDCRRLAPEALCAFLETEIQAVNAAVFAAAHAHPEYAGMGTTLVAGLFQPGRLCLAHIGDSRAYRLRAGCLARLTRDHSLLQEQIDCGALNEAEARYVDYKNLVTRALGVEALAAPECHLHDLAGDDLYLFCSDGLTDMVEDDDIASLLTACADNLMYAADELLALANANGGSDNISVILVRIGRDFAAPPTGWWAKLRHWLHRT